MSRNLGILFSSQCGFAKQKQHLCHLDAWLLSPVPYFYLAKYETLCCPAMVSDAGLMSKLFYINITFFTRTFNSFVHVQTKLTLYSLFLFYKVKGACLPAHGAEWMPGLKMKERSSVKSTAQRLVCVKSPREPETSEQTHWRVSSGYYLPENAYGGISLGRSERGGKG